MNHDITTNARVLHATLDKLRLLKELLRFKTLFETAEYAVAKEFNSEHVMQLLAQKKQADAANTRFDKLVGDALAAK